MLSRNGRPELFPYKRLYVQASNPPLPLEQAPPAHRANKFTTLATRIRFDDDELANKVIVEDRPADGSHPLMPKIPFSWLILGRSGAGKTTMLLNALRSAYLGKFHETYLFHPMHGVDATYRKGIEIPEDHVYEDWGPQDIENIIERKKEETRQLMGKYDDDMDKVRKHQKQTLIIIDDAFGRAEGDPHKKSAITSLINFNRKIGISVVMLAHGFRRQVNNHWRSNATDVSVYELPNAIDYEAFRDEMRAPGVSVRTFDQLFHLATRDKHSFLYVDLRAPPQTRYSRNFNERFVLSI